MLGSMISLTSIHQIINEFTLGTLKSSLSLVNESPGCLLLPCNQGCTHECKMSVFGWVKLFLDQSQIRKFTPFIIRHSVYKRFLHRNGKMKQKKSMSLLAKTISTSYNKKNQFNCPSRCRGGVVASFPGWPASWLRTVHRGNSLVFTNT